MLASCLLYNVEKYQCEKKLMFFPSSEKVYKMEGFAGYRIRSKKANIRTHPESIVVATLDQRDRK